MNHRQLSWTRKYNNNQFIIASRAYFQQSPTCTRVNNLVHIAMWLTLTGHIAMWPTSKEFTSVTKLVHIIMWLRLNEFWVWSCFSCERGFSQRVCNIQIRMYFANFYVNNALHGATLANCSHFQYVSRLRLRVTRIGVKACIDLTLYTELFITSIIEKHVLITPRTILTAVQWSIPGSFLYPLSDSWQGTLPVRYTVQHTIEPTSEA